MIDRAAIDPYDVLPWEGAPDPISHPSRLAVSIGLDGREPPLTASCRVLSIGCADGAGLLPLAARWPEARLVGVERSARQVARARESARELGLENLRIVEGDFRETSDELLGEADYVIAAGLLSWVPPEVVERGVAFVTCNAAPGWAIRGQLRDALRTWAGEADAPLEAVRRARTALGNLAAVLASADTDYGRLLAEEVRAAQDVPDSYLLHEYLSPHNRAFHLHELEALAKRHDLRIFSELARASADGIRELMIAGELERNGVDRGAAAQTADLLLFRQFRRVLLAPSGAPSPPRAPVDVIAGANLAGRLRAPDGAPSLREGETIAFTTESDATVRVDGAAQKAALLELAASPDRTRTFAQLREAVPARLSTAGVWGPGRRMDPEEEDTLRQGLAMLVRAGHVVAYADALGAAARVGERARATPLAMLEARLYGRVTDPFLRGHALAPEECALVGALGEGRSRGELLDEVAGFDEPTLEATLTRLSAAGALADD